MSRLFGSVVGAIAAASLIGSASAQSNALVRADGPAGATRDLSGAIDKGYQPFSLAAFEGFLARSSFKVTERQTAQDRNVVGITAAAPNGMPFVFLFRDCGVQGCLFMEAIQPFAPKKLGVPLGLSEVNEFNRTNPLQVIMTAEKNDEVGLRWTLPALAGCDQACADSALTLYFGGVLAIYEAVGKASKQMLVEAPFDEADPVLDFAALSARQGAPVDVAWGTASAAFGGAPDAADFGDMRGRLSAEIERLREQAKPGATSFPALLGR